jgi:putative acetyltransferase
MSGWKERESLLQKRKLNAGIPENRDVLDSIEIRQAALKDAAAIAAALHESFAEFRPLYTDGGFAATTPDATGVRARMAEGPVWVACRSSEVIGTVGAILRSTAVYIRGMAVVPAGRKSGVGARLLAETESYAAQTGCRRLFLTTTPFLHSAIRLYEKSGFRMTNERSDLFGTPLLTMEKLLLP